MLSRPLGRWPEWSTMLYPTTTEGINMLQIILVGIIVMCLITGGLKRETWKENRFRTPRYW